MGPSMNGKTTKRRPALKDGEKSPGDTAREFERSDSDEIEEVDEKKDEGRRKRAHAEDSQDELYPKASRPSEEVDDSEWTEDIHKEFVEAIYEIGLRNSSPAVILENMTQKSNTITSERVKSKLQKYRNNREKSRQEFMEEYEAFLHRVKAIESAGGAAGGAASPGAILELMGSNSLVGGDAAAFLSYAVMKEKEMAQSGDNEGSVLSTTLLKKGALEFVENFCGAGISFPQLTEAEKKSSLGVSMTFVMGLFLSVTQHVMRERAKAEQGRSNAEEPPTPEQREVNVDTSFGSYNPSAQPAEAKRSAKVSFSLDQAVQFARYPMHQYVPALSTEIVGSSRDTSQKNLVSPITACDSEMI